MRLTKAARLWWTTGYELETLAGLDTGLAGDRPIRIMLRLTPGIECHTHDYIRTGSIDSKFGFDPQQIEQVYANSSASSLVWNASVCTPISAPKFLSCNPIMIWVQSWCSGLQKAAQYGLPVQQLDIGGGLGIRYTESDDPPSIDEWVKTVCLAIIEACESQGLSLPKLIAEPGRSLIGSACVTAYTMGSQKEVPNIRRYVTVDGGMSDNPRPITYQSTYRAIVANRMSAEMSETVTIAGKHCESGDIVIKNAQLPKTQPGDILVVMGTGAYNYSMASNYNRLARPAAVLVHDGEASLILERETYHDLVRQDRLPTRLMKQGADSASGNQSASSNQ